LWREFEGGVQDWLLQPKRSKEIQNAANSNVVTAQKTVSRSQSDSKAAEPKKSAVQKKLGNKEQRELDALPGQIEALEQEQAAVRLELADASLYAKDPLRARALYTRDATLEEELLSALARWETLSS
jgi:ATP-binding cassette subfamily F protein uup